VLVQLLYTGDDGSRIHHVGEPVSRSPPRWFVGRPLSRVYQYASFRPEFVVPNTHAQDIRRSLESIFQGVLATKLPCVARVEGRPPPHC